MVLADVWPDGCEHTGMRVTRRLDRFALAAVVLVAGGAGSAATGWAADEPRTDVLRGVPDQQVVTVGRSVRGRPIVARVIGDPAAPRHVLIVGCIHGTERAGEAITRALRGGGPRDGTNWWVVDRFNPDGCNAATQTRQNARGVDLNRNSPWNWGTKDRPGGTFYAGPKALSEPESKAINTLIATLRPAVSVWFHQHAAMVDTSSGGSHAIERRYARTVGLPAREYGTVHGSITSWQNARFPADTAFVVELPAGTLSATAVDRHVQAIEAL